MANFVKVIAVGVIVIGAGVGLSRDESDKAGAPKPKGAEGGALTATDLVTLFENMGYEVKQTKDDKMVVTGGSFRYEAASYNSTVNFSLSSNQSWVWLSIWLKQPPNQKIPADKMRALLAINDEVGPSYFAYNEESNFLRLKTPIHNRGIKPPIIRAMLKHMEETMGNPKYAAAWDPAKWDKGGAKDVKDKSGEAKPTGK